MDCTVLAFGCDLASLVLPIRVQTIDGGKNQPADEEWVRDGVVDQPTAHETRVKNEEEPADEKFTFGSDEDTESDVDKRHSSRTGVSADDLPGGKKQLRYESLSSWAVHVHHRLIAIWRAWCNTP